MFGSISFFHFPPVSFFFLQAAAAKPDSILPGTDPTDIVTDDEEVRRGIILSEYVYISAILQIKRKH